MMAAESLEGRNGTSMCVTSTISVPVVRTPSEEQDGTKHCQSSQDCFDSSDVATDLTTMDASVADLVLNLAAKDAEIAELRQLINQMRGEIRDIQTAKDNTIDQLTRKVNDLQSQLYSSELVTTSINKPADSRQDEIDQLQMATMEETNDGFHESVEFKSLRGKENLLSEQPQREGMCQQFLSQFDEFTCSTNQQQYGRMLVPEADHEFQDTTCSPLQVSQSDHFHSGRAKESDVQRQRITKLNCNESTTLDSLIEKLDITSYTQPVSEDMSIESLASSCNLPIPTTLCSLAGNKRLSDSVLDLLIFPTPFSVESEDFTDKSEIGQLNPAAMQSQLSSTKVSDSDFLREHSKCDQLLSHNRKRPCEKDETEDRGIKRPKLIKVKDEASSIKDESGFMIEWETLANKCKNASSFALKLMDVFFDKKTLAGSLVYGSEKTQKPPLDPEKIKKIFELCKKYFSGDFKKETVKYKMDCKCRDTIKFLKRQRGRLSSNVDTENSIQKNSNIVDNYSNSKKTQPANCRSGNVAHCGDENKNVEESVMAIRNPLFTLLKRDMNLVKHCDGWLNDNIITASQKILAQQFPHVKGLQPPTLQQVGAFKAHNEEFVQIINVGGIHWCVVSTIGCEAGEVKVYDTVYHKVQPSTIPIITGLLSCPTPLRIHMMDVGKQCNSSDCGVLSVAIAFDLCSGHDPTKVEYEHSRTREHLEASIRNCSLSRFPIRGPRTSTGIVCSKEI